MTLTPEILLKRLTNFANDCRDLTKKLSKNSYNIIYSNQLNRSASSPGANYIEAIEAASPKEFILKLKTCRKEAKESGYWLDLIKTANITDKEIFNKSNQFQLLLLKEIKKLRNKMKYGNSKIENNLLVVS